MAVERSSLASLVNDFERLRRNVAIVAAHGLRRERITYGDLAELCRRFACELTNRRIDKGERVILCGENGINWVAAFFGCVLRGVLPVPLDAGSSAEFLHRVEAEVTPRLVVADPDLAENFISPVVLLPSLADSISAAADKAMVELAEDDPLQIIFTSGTTGEPKGVVHTHKNVLASLLPIEREMQKYLKYERIFHPVRFLHTLPLSHVFGQFMGLWIPPLLGAEVHFESKLLAQDLIEYIRDRRISVVCSVPRVLSLLQRRIQDCFPGLRGRMEAASGTSVWKRWLKFRDIHRVFGFKFWAFICGGAPLTLESEGFWRSLGFAVVQGYGMTETTALVSLNHPFKAASGTIGQVLPGREVRLGPDGEVLVRGETISNKTWQHGNIRREESAWLATGDLAEFDENGNLRFKGRKKDVIVTAAGLNIYPEDLEAVLRSQRGVRDVAVIESDGAHGPEPLAVLLLDTGTDPGAVAADANERLADFQRLRRWYVWPEADLPRTSTGKVLKRQIASLLAQGAVSATPDQISLDSLGRVELQARLEQQYGVSVDDAALQQVTTPGDVRDLIAKAAANPQLSHSSNREHVYPKWPWNPVMQFLRAAFLETLALPILRFLAAPKCISRVGHFPQGPVLIVANHVTSYDVPFVLEALPGRIRRHCTVAMSGEMLIDFRRARKQGNRLQNLLAPLAYALITGLFNVFPLPQYSGFRRSFRHAGEAADRGYSVLVFPEGRRSPDGAAQPFMRGTGLLWKELGTAAVAIKVEGLGELKTTRANWFRSGKVTVTVQGVFPLDLQSSPEALTELLQQAVFPRPVQRH